MKILTVVIPCYNSEEYMEKCVESILRAGDDVQILIVNDGSTDNTKMIADRFANEYPDIIEAVHKQNGGHGSAINTGLKHATGMYFKVVDSDDWVDVSSLHKIIEKLKKLRDTRKNVDALISNFVYEKEGQLRKKVVQFKRVFPENVEFGWNQVKSFRKGQYLLMHALIFRTKLLKECRLQLPEHTFYVDNLFAYVPLRKVHKMMYLDCNFYRYYIGRADQSVNENIMIQRIDQQIKVNKLMVDAIDLAQIEERNLRKYLLHYLEIVTIVSSTLLIKSGKKENIAKKQALWRYIKTNNRKVYRRLRYGLLGEIVNFPGEWGRKVTVLLYRYIQKRVGFN
jgi:Glycosyltransferases involved in cell wall biogenesis